MFDREVAEQYDAWYDTKLGSFVDETETACAFRLLQPSSEDSILDLGCGTGNFSLKLAREGADVTGIDISDAMLDVANEKSTCEDLTIDFRNMDAHNLKFNDHSFDAVLSMATLEFVEDPQEVFDEMIRVTKPGGRIVIGVIHEDSPWGELYAQQAEQGDPVFSGANLKTRDDLRQLDSEYLIEIDSCLYLPPDIDEESISWEEEREREGSEAAGFLCGLWRKQE